MGHHERTPARSTGDMELLKPEKSRACTLALSVVKGLQSVVSKPISVATNLHSCIYCDPR